MDKSVCQALEDAARLRMKELYPDLLEDWHPAEIQLENIQVIGDKSGNDCGITIFTDAASSSDFVPLLILTEISESGGCEYPGYIQSSNPLFKTLIGIALDERLKADRRGDDNDSGDFPSPEQPA